MSWNPMQLRGIAPHIGAAEPDLWTAHTAAHTAARAGTASSALVQFMARLFPAAPVTSKPLSRRTGPALSLPTMPRVGGQRAATDILAEDRDLLFAAIAARLRHSVDEPRLAPVARRDNVVLECVQALEQLQGALVNERGYCQRIESELVEAREKLVAAQVELVGTQAGERRARHEAAHDSLTLLPNRSSFSARLDEVLNGTEHNSPALAVLFLDLDGFKPINDRHGHDTGDELLRIVAQRLSRSIRAGDMVCRLGGDEFACLLSNTLGREQLSQLAAKLFDAVSAPLQVGAVKLTVRPSIGIAMCPTDGNTAVALLKRADTAMYRAKRRQLGFAFFERGTDA